MVTVAAEAAPKAPFDRSVAKIADECSVAKVELGLLVRCGKRVARAEKRIAAVGAGRCRAALAGRRPVSMHLLSTASTATGVAAEVSGDAAAVAEPPR